MRPAKAEVAVTGGSMTGIAAHETKARTPSIQRYVLSGQVQTAVEQVDVLQHRVGERERVATTGLVRQGAGVGLNRAIVDGAFGFELVVELTES